MKKTGKWTLSAALFIIIGLFMFSSISDVLRQKTAGSIDMVNTFYDVEENTLDVIGIGSSHLYYSLQPNLLWDEYGITSYILGSPQQTLPTSYYLLKEALTYQKPKVVLLESYYFFGDKLYNSEARLRQAFDGMRFGKTKLEMVENLLEAEGERSIKEKLSWYLPFLLYHQRWSDLEDSDFNTKPYLKGAQLVTDVYEQDDPGLDIPAQEIPDQNYEYFEKICALCEENGASLVVYAAPYNIKKRKQYEQRQGVNFTLEKYLEEQGVPFLFYQKTGEANIDFATDFCDQAHMNLSGQTKISRCIGRYLSENYGLQGHKDDPVYDTWNQEYELFARDVELLRAEAE